MQNNKFILIYVMPISTMDADGHNNFFFSLCTLLEVARTKFGPLTAKHGHMDFILPFQIDWKLPITYFPNARC